MITHQIKQENFEEFSARVKRTFAEFPAKVMEKTIDIMQRGMKLITNSCRKRIGIQDSPLYLQFLYHQKKYISFVYLQFWVILPCCSVLFKFRESFLLANSGVFMLCLLK